MVIVLDFGTWWVEALTNQITLQDAAGRYTSGTANLQREGVLIGMVGNFHALQNAIDNVENIGGLEVMNQSLAYTIGARITGSRCRVTKAIGVDGNVTVDVHVVVLVRKIG